VLLVEQTANHAANCDVVRELIEGGGGRDSSDVGDERWWSAYVAKIQAAAETFGTPQP
jgi:hypothetical protein